APRPDRGARAERRRARPSAGPVHPPAGRRRAEPGIPLLPGRTALIRQYLHDGWQLTATTAEVPDIVRGRSVPATVPGSTHLDLLASGLITDPFLDQAEAELTWMHRADWR